MSKSLTTLNSCFIAILALFLTQACGGMEDDLGIGQQEQAALTSYRGTIVLQGGDTPTSISGLAIPVTQWGTPTSPIKSDGSGSVETAGSCAFSFSKELDAMSKELLRMSQQLSRIEQFKFEAYRSSGNGGGNQQGVPYLNVEMDSLVITSYSISEVDDVPRERICLNYAK